jgi:putative hydrolase of the HAD superfamily
MTAKDYIKDYEVLIFDMGKTFMFGGDRFGEKQDYYDTYMSFGGFAISETELKELINHIYSTMLVISRTPYLFDNMPTVREFLDLDMRFDIFDNHEKDLVEQVFAYHECGTVPHECRQTLRELSISHKLGIISNVWCKSMYFTQKLKSEKVHDYFEHIVLSSDFETIKPSPKIFGIAIEYFGIDPAQIVYVGDNYKRDVIGSKNAGMKCIWVNQNGLHPETIKPDLEIKHISELV